MQGDVHKFGMAKEGLIARQFMLEVVQTADGLPIYHEVFDGNTAEARTLLPILNNVMARFPALRRLIVVSINGAQPLSGVSSISAEDSKVFKALKVEPPSQTQQMSLL